MYGKQRQRGVTLLIVVIIMMLASITYIFTGISTDEIQVERKIINSRVLKEAKNALLAHALTNSYRATNLGEIGNLPCPDANNNISPEGDQDPSCGNLNRNSIGYFPWKRMGIEVLKDESGTCLLYAVSPSYKLNDPRMLNQDSNGMFQIVDIGNTVIDGNSPEDRIVAVVFAPNSAVGSQTRNFDNTTLCGKDVSNLSAYLDNTGVKDNSVLSGTDNTIDQFVHATSTSADDNNPLNDTFVTIKKSEIWGAIFSKTDLRNKLDELTEAIAVCLSDYANNTANTYRQLPWPAPLDLSASPNSYFNDDNYDDVDASAQGYAGRLPYKVDSSNAKTGMIGVDLFTTAACTAVDLPSTGAVVETIDLSNTGEHGIIWHNWKDHFYYALSKNYQPDITATGDSVCNGANGCVSMNGVSNEFAAIVFFSDVSRNGVARTSAEAGDLDQKAIIANYIENNNDIDFPDGSGEGDYQSGLANSNDLMFCINDMSVGNDLTVAAC